MADYQFKLEPYKGMKTRFHCPLCNNREKTFARYIDTTTGSYLSSEVGKCNRDSRCGYHYTPKQYFQDNPLGYEKLANPNILHARARIMPETQVVSTSYIPDEIIMASLKGHLINNFVCYLNQLFGSKVTSELVRQYCIGTCNYWPGGTVFWQIDIEGRVRTGKLMLYNSHTGKRVKEPYNHINWVHALKDNEKNPLYPDYQLKQCFFGEHLLRQNANKTVAIVESEKTAIIASIYLPEFVWLACGSKEGLNKEKCEVLQTRSVILYPDLKCFDRWNDIKKMLAKVNISSVLERNATESEKASGLDLADYLLRYPFRQDAPEDSGNLTEANISVIYHKCFEGKSGRIYIQNPTAYDRYAVYNSVDAYNARLELPEYTSSVLAMLDYAKERQIDHDSLTIKNVP